MTQEIAPMNRVTEHAEWTSAGALPGAEVIPYIHTLHLPDDVVQTPFLLCLDSRTNAENPRMGGYWFTLNYGDQMNPKDLTEDQKEYIIETLTFALENLWLSTPLEDELRLREELVCEHKHTEYVDYTQCVHCVDCKVHISDLEE